MMLTKTLTGLSEGEVPLTTPTPGLDCSLELTADPNAQPKEDKKRKFEEEPAAGRQDDTGKRAAMSSQGESMTDEEAMQKFQREMKKQDLEVVEDKTSSAAEATDDAETTGSQSRRPVSFKISKVPMAKVQAIWPKVFGRKVF